MQTERQAAPEEETHEKKKLTLEERLVNLLRKSGHILRVNAHGENKPCEEMLRCLTEEEKRALLAILRKCVTSWKE